MIPVIIEPLLKPLEVAKTLGVSKSLAYKLIQTGELPSIKIASSVRVAPADLSKFISANRQSVEKINFRNN